eukprot:gb/GFBE01060135.1/.p1 GENE.gb/GFBE01060135.1/~~gb/GFBE01060135.1/.p1  ORF type:complete len:367 (+),score=76.66 gb/GFBE01060135.1/:1-1101(+)
MPSSFAHLGGYEPSDQEQQLLNTCLLGRDRRHENSPSRKRQLDKQSASLEVTNNAEKQQRKLNTGANEADTPAADSCAARKRKEPRPWRKPSNDPLGDMEGTNPKTTLLQWANAALPRPSQKGDIVFQNIQVGPRLWRSVLTLNFLETPVSVEGQAEGTKLLADRSAARTAVNRFRYEITKSLCQKKVAQAEKKVARQKRLLELHSQRSAEENKQLQEGLDSCQAALDAAEIEKLEAESEKHTALQQSSSQAALDRYRLEDKYQKKVDQLRTFLKDTLTKEAEESHQKDQKAREQKAKIDHLTKELQESQKSKECIICMTSPKDHAMLPCGHLFCCEACAARLISERETCAICKKKVDGFAKIFVQ